MKDNVTMMMLMMMKRDEEEEREKQRERETQRREEGDKGNKTAPCDCSTFNGQLMEKPQTGREREDRWRCGQVERDRDRERESR